MTAQTDRLDTALVQRYRIERHLGEGGMATVYLAEDLKHDRRVALKLLKPGEVAQRHTVPSNGAANFESARRVFTALSRSTSIHTSTRVVGELPVGATQSVVVDVALPTTRSDYRT